jgi:hypothetical protein
MASVGKHAERVAGTDHWAKYAPGTPGNLSAEQQEVRPLRIACGVCAPWTAALSGCRLTPYPLPTPFNITIHSDCPASSRETSLQMLEKFLAACPKDNVDEMRFPREPADHFG